MGSVVAYLALATLAGVAAIKLYSFVTLKFILCLWGLTYIGSWFNMMTLIILTWCGFFSVPLVYKNNQAAVDDVLGQINSQMSDIKEKVMGVIPSKSKDSMKKEE